MARFFLHQDSTEISIPFARDIDNITVYMIRIKIDSVEWTVKHRYSDFYNLNSILVSDHGVSKDIFPPKKIIRTKCPQFIEKRREALEVYLKSIFNYLRRALPQELAVFLDFHLYDIDYLLQDMALKYFTEGDKLVNSLNGLTLSPLELHAISQRLKYPCPESNDEDKRRDFTHVMDVCSRTKILKILGSNHCYLESDIIPNYLNVNLSSFKALTTLKLHQYPMENISVLGTLRNTLQFLIINSTKITNIKSALLCDSVHKMPLSDSEIWNKLEEIDFSGNQISDIDDSVRLLPKVVTIILNQNNISNITNLSHLPNLSTLQISANQISVCENLHTKLGNLRHLDLSQNYITSLVGFSKLFSLESLNLSSNRVISLDEVKHIGHLPCLENLVLTGNPVSTVVDYRVKVLEQFGPRANELCLDNEIPTQKELDTVCVLQAIRIVKEGKSPIFQNDSKAPLFLCNSTNNFI